MRLVAFGRIIGMRAPIGDVGGLDIGKTCYMLLIRSIVDVHLWLVLDVRNKISIHVAMSRDVGNQTHVVPRRPMDIVGLVGSIIRIKKKRRRSNEDPSK